MTTEGRWGRTQHVRPMTRDEARTLQEWVVADHWDEGDWDADVLFDIDPDGFWAILDDDGSMVGGLTIVASPDNVGTVSLFFMQPSARGRGVAKRALADLLALLGHRITDDISLTNFSWPWSIEATRVWGFVPLFPEVRMVHSAGSVEPPSDDASIVDARTLSEDAVIAFDAVRAGRRRDVLWRRWLSLPGSATLAAMDGNGAIRGLGTIRPSALGHRIGPLLAVTPDDAATLLRHLMAQGHGTRVAMDMPSANPNAEPLAISQGFAEEFRTVRTIWGVVPELPWHERYATVTLHLD